MSGRYLSISDLLHRVAAELGVAADEVAAIEEACAPTVTAAHELQTLDKLGQTLRALEVFLCMVALDAEGEVDIAEALPTVPLERLRSWLADASSAAQPSREPELW